MAPSPCFPPPGLRGSRRRGRAGKEQAARMNFEGIIAIINRRSGIYNQVINSWTRREGEGGCRGTAGINCSAGKGCHLRLRSGAGI